MPDIARIFCHVFFREALSLRRHIRAGAVFSAKRMVLRRAQFAELGVTSVGELVAKAVELRECARVVICHVVDFDEGRQRHHCTVCRHRGDDRLHREDCPVYRLHAAYDALQPAELPRGTLDTVGPVGVSDPVGP